MFIRCRPTCCDEVMIVVQMVLALFSIAHLPTKLLTFLDNRSRWGPLSSSTKCCQAKRPTASWSCTGPWSTPAQGRGLLTAAPQSEIKEGSPLETNDGFAMIGPWLVEAVTPLSWPSEGCWRKSCRRSMLMNPSQLACPIKGDIVNILKI